MEIFVGLVLFLFLVIICMAFAEELTYAVDTAMLYTLCGLARIQNWFEDHCK